MLLLRLLWAVVHALFAKKADLVAENLGLREQLKVLRRNLGDDSRGDRRRAVVRRRLRALGQHVG